MNKSSYREPDWVRAARVSGWAPPDSIDQMVTEFQEFVREYENDLDLCESVIDALVDERVRFREELKELDEYKRDVLENVTERNVVALTLGGAREGEKTLQEVAERVVKKHAASIDNLRDVITSLTEAVKGQQERVTKREDDLHVLRSELEDAQSEIRALKIRLAESK